MRSLIVPMMGKSSRFPNMRPKWMLTHPTGGFMAIEALKGLQLHEFSTVYFVMLRKYEEQYSFVKSFTEEIRLINDTIDIKFLFLDEQTQSQPETVYHCIKKMGITGPILVKDSDNFFVATIDISDNYICYFDLNDGNQFNARNKAYIEFDSNGFISNVVEKKIISSTFSVGGYGFKSAEQFCEYFEKLQHTNYEIYLSNIIFEMILDNHKFSGIKTQQYEDWGTLQEWNSYKKSFRTLFIDLDGTLIENTSTKMIPFIGTGAPIENNIRLLQQLHERGRTKIILVTARPSKYKEITESELRKHNIPYDMLLMDMLHAQRIVINDFADSNPFPSCSSINIQRNSDNLEDYLI